LKIGVLSDTHLTRCDEFLKATLDKYFSDVDIILHAGDIVELDVLDMFRGRDVRAVCGNMDLPSVRAQLSHKMQFTLEGIRFGLIHGWGNPMGIRSRIRQAFEHIDCLVYGHTHQAFNEVRDGVLCFNPGSPFGGIFSSKKTVGILEINNGISGKIIEL
jgi:uncharacterized protein